MKKNIFKIILLIISFAGFGQRNNGGYATVNNAMDRHTTSATLSGQVLNFAGVNNLPPYSVNLSGLLSTGTNLFQFNKTIGYRRTVNGIVSSQLVGSGTIFDILGFNSSGVPIYMPLSTFLTQNTTVLNTSSVNTLSTTVNGVVGAGVPIINSNTLNWTKASGITSTVNGIAAIKTVPVGTAVDMIGYDASGNPVNQTLSSLASNSHFYSAAGATIKPDGITDLTENIRRNGNVGLNADPTTTLHVNSTIANTSGLRLEQIKQGVTLSQGIGTVAIGVDNTGLVQVTNGVGASDTRAINNIPQEYNVGEYKEFKQASTLGLPANIGTYVGLTTFRKYANGADFSGGQVRQEAYTDAGLLYYRMSTSATTWGVWQRQGSGTRPAMQPRFTSQANTKISINGEVRWAGFYHIMSAGTNASEPAGHFRIDMPADGFGVPVLGGGTRAVVAATAGSSIATGGILLNAWETLWYKHPYGNAAASNSANFLITPYTASGADSPFINPEDWIKIASRDDGSTFSLGTGDVVGLCSQTGRGGKITSDNWSAMRNRAMGDGYYFTMGGNTAVPTTFGYTGTIRWINGGSTPYVNGAGYLDAPQSTKVAGTAIAGVNGATARTWRLITAVEKPEWFGGALRGSNAIVSASTTIVDLNDNETLYYVPNIESGTASGQWVVSGYAGLVSIPIHWMPIASRQTTGANSTVQVLIGGVQYGLKAGDARLTSTNDGVIDGITRKFGVVHKGLKFARWTTSNLFTGTGANGLMGSANGIYISWDDNSLIYGISDGYASFGNQYNYINVPTAGFAIPVATVNSNVTRVVKQIGTKRYLPLGVWEALYFIPPSYAGGSGSVNGDFVIGYYNGNHSIPPNAVLIAKYEGNNSTATGDGIIKQRVRFADGTYLQPGYTFPLSVAVEAENDQAQGSGDWRTIFAAGSTPTGATAPLTVVAGIVSTPYSAPYNAQFRYLPNDNDPRGTIHLKGIIQMNANVTASSPTIAFLPGVRVLGEPIIGTYVINSTLGDNKMIPVQLRFQNSTINGSAGVSIVLYASSGNPASNPYFTLGNNGATSAAGTSLWLTLDNIILNHN